MALSLEGLHDDVPRDAIPQQTNGFELTETACCWLLREMGSSRVVKLNDSSLLIWQMCGGELSVGEIIQALVEQYPGVDSIEKDVNRAIGELADEGVIKLNG